MYAFECILNLGLVFVAADQKSYCGVLGRGFDQVINSIDVEIELPGEFRLEWNSLELHDNVAVERNVEEEHIQLPGLAGNDDLPLATEIRKAGPELQQESGQLSFQFALQLLFLIFIWQRDEAEVVDVFGDRLGETALGRRQFASEVCDCAA